MLRNLIVLSLLLISTSISAATISFNNGDIYQGSFDLLDYEFNGNQVLPTYNRIGASVSFDSVDALDQGESILVELTYGGGQLISYTFNGTTSGLLGDNTLNTVTPFSETQGTITVTATGSFNLSGLGVTSKGNLEGTQSQLVFNLDVLDNITSAAVVPLPPAGGLLLMALAGVISLRTRRRIQ